MSDPLTSSLAVYGALLATTTAAIQIIKHYRDKARLFLRLVSYYRPIEELRHSPSFPLPDLPDDIPDDAKRVYSVVKLIVTNIGTQPITLSRIHVDCFYADGYNSKVMSNAEGQLPVKLMPTDQIELPATLSWKWPISIRAIVLEDSAGRLWHVKGKELRQLHLGPEPPAHWSPWRDWQGRKGGD